MKRGFVGSFVVLALSAGLAGLLGPGLAQAQITLTNSVFPVAGDTFSWAIDTHPGPQIVNTPPGPNQVWDFSSLQRSATWTEVMRPAATGAGASSFPDATLVYTQTGPSSFPNIPGSNATEAYLKVTDTAVSLLGFHGGPGVLNVGVPSVTRFQPGVVVSEAPTAFFDIRTFSTSFSAEISPADIPGLVLQNPGNLIDRYRISETLLGSVVVDGSGTLTLPGGSFEVLRETRRLFSTVVLEGHFSGGWFRLSDSSLLDKDSPIAPYLHVFGQVSHAYLGAESKQALAIVYSPVSIDPPGPSVLDELPIAQVQFKNLGASAVPEPGTGWMFLVGLCAVPAARSAMRRRGR